MFFFCLPRSLSCSLLPYCSVLLCFEPVISLYLSSFHLRIGLALHTFVHYLLLLLLHQFTNGFGCFLLNTSSTSFCYVCLFVHLTVKFAHFPYSLTSSLKIVTFVKLFLIVSLSFNSYLLVASVHLLACDSQCVFLFFFFCLLLLVAFKALSLICLTLFHFFVLFSSVSGSQFLVHWRVVVFIFIFCEKRKQ